MKPYRAGLIRKIKTIQNQVLGISDDDYRAMLEARYGKTSATKLTIPELKDVCSFLDDLTGQKPPTTKNRPNAQARKIWTLWQELYKAHAVRNPSQFALNQFIKNRCRVKVDSYLWLNTQQAIGVIEILKQWLLRHGGDVI